MEILTRRATATDRTIEGLPYISSYVFEEYEDTDHKDGFVYAFFRNNELTDKVKSSRKSHEFNQLASDARKAIYQKNLKGVGQFTVETF